MKYILLICLSMIIFACANNAELKKQPAAKPGESEGKKVTTELKHYTFDVIRTFDHDPMAYTQGLFLHDGILFESTGQRGESSLRKVDPENGKVLKKIDLPAEYFGEGITLFNDDIYMLTWTSGKCFVYDVNTFKLKKEFKYPGEGWGLTDYEDSLLIMTDGSNFIRFVDPENFTVKNTIALYYQGAPINALNEVERVGNLLFANIYTTDQIAVIDIAADELIGLINCGELRKTLQDNPNAEAFNGIAYDKDTKHFYVTGKYWNKMFEIQINDLFE